ncbi:MAG: hypothetical protein Q9222_004269 [Ikaeria aurantiellina]
MASASQLYLLADHIKLSLLERQRAISLNLEPNSQDGHISRSLDSFREGVEALEQQQRQLAASDSSTSTDLQDQIQRLRTQYDDLTSQFRGFPTNTTSSTATQPNDPTLSPAFARAKDPRPRIPSSSSFKRNPGTSPNPSKSVRFTDSPSISAQDDAAAEAANRAALFPYRDEPEAPDQSQLDNQQIHDYHQNVLREQDEQLDRLGDSIGRQRELSMQIGDELDDHVQMLEEVEGHVDRHQTTLDGARRSLGNVARKARDNKQLTIILVLIMILIIVILIVK